METILDLPTIPCKAEAAELETSNEEISAGSKRMTSKDWRATLVAILWTRLTLQNWRAKLISLLVAMTVWYLIQKNMGMTSSPSESSSAAAVSQPR